MADGQRANAAQMAARNIKSAKPRSGARRQGGSLMNKADQTPQFAPMPGEPAGGMFGGSVQGASGSFNFAAPAGVPAMTFGSQSQSFGNSSQDTYDSDGHVTDGRATKRQFGGSSTMPANNSFPPFDQSAGNQFSANQPQQASGGNIFSFGSTQPQATPSLNFGASSNTGFQFGASSKPAPSSPAHFGSGPVETQPTSNSFQFGQSNQNQGGGFSFGKSIQQEKPASTPFQFGQNSSTSGGIFNSVPAPSAPTTSFQFGSGSGPAIPPFSSAPSSSFQFGSGSKTAAPSSPFGFGSGSTPATSAPSTSFTFGPGPASPAPAAPNTSFNFGSTAPAAPSTNFNFGSGSNSASANTSFNFGASATSAPATNFNMTATTQAPSSTLFGSPKPAEAQQPTNMFAPTSQAPAPSLFSHLNTAAPTPTNHLFGKPKESPAPTNNIFGNLNGQASSQPANNMFSSSSQPASTPNMFAEKKVEQAPPSMFGQSTPAPVTSTLFGAEKPTATTSNIFGSLNSSSPSTASTMFSSQPTHPTAPASNLFGAPIKETSSSNDLFGNLNKPVDSSLNPPQTNGTSNGASATPAKTNPFQSIPPPTPVMQPKPLFSAPAPSEPVSSPVTNGVSKSLFSFGAVQPTATESSPKSTPMKAIGAPRTASQPPPNGMFPTLSRTSQSLPRISDASGLPPNKMLATVQGDDIISSLVCTRETSDSTIRAKIPGSYNAQDSSKFLATYRITMLNRAMQEVWATIGVRDATAAFDYYTEERALIISRYGVTMSEKRKPLHQEDNTPSKRLLQDGPVLPEPTSKRKVTDDEGFSESVSKRNRLVEPSHSTTNDVARLTETPPSLSSPAVSNPFSMNGASTKAPVLPAPTIASPAKSKRKATDELTQNTEQLSPLRRELKTPKINGSTSSPRSGSQTSNIFKNILESPSESTPMTSPKKASSPTKPAEEAPRFNPFGSLAVPKSPAKPADDAPHFNPFGSIAVPASPAKFVPTPAAATNAASVAPVKSNLFGATPATNTNAPTTSSPFVVSAPATTSGPLKMPSAPAPASGPLKMPSFGAASGSVNFLAQFGAQAKKSEEEAEAKKLQDAIDEDYDSEDESLAEFKANWHKKRVEEKKELAEIAKNGQGFKFGAVKPKADEASSTPKKPAAETVAKTSETAAPKPMFGLNASSQGSGSSVFSSLNSSRAPTPGLFGSTSGSVLNGNTPAKVAFSGNNIFGHLSDVDSGKDEADDDDDSAEGESGDEDSEKKDADYKPQAEAGSDTPPEKTGVGIAFTKKSNPFGLASNFGASSGTSTPGGLFGRVSKDSTKNGDESPEEKDDGGTSTPGGSLFDRITKGADGKPMRHISTEEKENTQPSSRNIFGDAKNPFSKSVNNTSAPVDKTWKTSSPIKFGTASSDTPSIDITAATPVKPASSFFGGFGTAPPAASSTSNLFGSKTDAKPFSNLFGTSSTSEAAPANVGFGFGAPAAASSSLFASAVPSAATSRATTPGATTDGDSGAEVDPDAEKHEQIDLTAGGPGEENEKVVHEVRTKALKFVAKEKGDTDSPWETKGLGPLRILKHKETGVTRILMRQDPSGTVVLNKSILGAVNYVSSGKTVKLLTTADSGEGLETWMLQVKTLQMAEELAKMLEANKAS